MCNGSSRNGCCGCPICNALKNLFAVGSCGSCSSCSSCSSCGGCAARSYEGCGGFGSCSAQCCCTEAYYARQYGLMNANTGGCGCRTCAFYTACSPCGADNAS